LKTPNATTIRDPSQKNHSDVAQTEQIPVANRHAGAQHADAFQEFYRVISACPSGKKRAAAARIAYAECATVSWRPRVSRVRRVLFRP
jgi:septum formation inhibitor-activating ATPase MinD